MKLDRNTNRGGHGKYALVNMRKMIPIIDQNEGARLIVDAEKLDAFNLLVGCGIITLGNESPGDQFFVLKYKDRFTGAALDAYTEAIMEHSKRTGSADLLEYAEQMTDETVRAYELGNRIPD
jgi:hypothetical protein